MQDAVLLLMSPRCPLATNIWVWNTISPDPTLVRTKESLRNGSQSLNKRPTCSQKGSLLPSSKLSANYWWGGSVIVEICFNAKHSHLPVYLHLHQLLRSSTFVLSPILVALEPFPKWHSVDPNFESSLNLPTASCGFHPISRLTRLASSHYHDSIQRLDLLHYLQRY